MANNNIIYAILTYPGPGYNSRQDPGTKHETCSQWYRKSVATHRHQAGSVLHQTSFVNQPGLLLGAIFNCCCLHHPTEMCGVIWTQISPQIVKFLIFQHLCQNLTPEPKKQAHQQYIQHSEYLHSSISWFSGWIPLQGQLWCLMLSSNLS